MRFCAVNPVLQDAVSRLTIAPEGCEFYGVPQSKVLLLCEDL